MSNRNEADQIIAAGRQVETITPGTSGNLSCRVGHDGFVITPSGVPYHVLTPDDLVTVSLATETVVAGRRVPSTEWRMHRAIYQARPDVAAIVHVHSFYATLLSTLGRPVKAVHYQLSWVGDEVGVADYATYGTDQLAANAVVGLGLSGAVLLKNHGLVTAAGSMGQALAFARDVEWVASLYVQALPLGEPDVLTPAQLQDVRGQFRHYGQPPS